MNCEHCKLRARYDANPRSLLGRLWRWHVRFCPGWHRYFKALPEECQTDLIRRYSLDRVSGR